MKKIIFIFIVLFASFNANCHAQSWSDDPHCLGIIYVDVDRNELLGSGSEMYLQGCIPAELNSSSFYGWSMQGLGSPCLYSQNGIYFYFSIIKSHLRIEYTINPDGIFTAELYVGENSTINFSTAESFYIVQYQIYDFNAN